MRYLLLLILFISAISCKTADLGKRCSINYLTTDYFAMTGQSMAIDALESVKLKFYHGRAGTSQLYKHAENTKLIDTVKIKEFTGRKNAYYLVNFKLYDTVHYALAGPHGFVADSSYVHYSQSNATLYLDSSTSQLKSNEHQVWFRLFARPIAFSEGLENPISMPNFKDNNYWKKETPKFFRRVRRAIDKMDYSENPYIKYYQVIFYPRWEGAENYKVLNNRGRYGKFKVTVEDGKEYLLTFNRNFPSCYRLEIME